MSTSQTSNSQQQIQDPFQALKAIQQGDLGDVINEEDRKVRMVETGTRIPNVVLRQTVKKLRAKGLTDKQIIDKILFFDELAEDGKLLEYLENQKKSK